MVWHGEFPSEPHQRHTGPRSHRPKVTGRRPRASGSGRHASSSSSERPTCWARAVSCSRQHAARDTPYIRSRRRTTAPPMVGAGPSRPPAAQARSSAQPSASRADDERQSKRLLRVVPAGPAEQPRRVGVATGQHLLVRAGESAARRSPRPASPLEKRLPIMIILCYAEISEVGQPRPGAGLATPPLAGTTGPSPIRCRAFFSFRAS